MAGSQRLRWVLAIVVATGVALVGGQSAATATSSAAVRASTPAAVRAAAPGAITMRVQSARTVRNAPGFVHAGDAVTAYRWMINADDTGDPGTLTNQNLAHCLPATATGGSTNPDYADTCPWPSTRPTDGSAAIIAQGDESDLSTTKALSSLPGGKYLISVTADGYKMDGAHFTVDGGTQQVTVGMQPLPLPLTTLKIQVFNDNAPVDATFEADAEPGVTGFTAHLTDVFGDVSVDYYGNALCTVYQHTVASDPGSPLLIDTATNRPVVDTARSTGRCVSDANGVITIPNMGPDRYAATVTPPVPPAGQTWRWVQTTTLEGGHDHDIWAQEGETGFDTEVTKGAELVPMVQFGFVRTQALPATTSITGEIKGQVNAGLPYIGGKGGQLGPEGMTGTKLGPPIVAPWVALSDLNRGDQQVYVGRGASNGSFDIKNVPNGTYQVTLWDDLQDYIIWSFNVTVSGGQTVNVGTQLLVGWFTHVQGTIFVDRNGDGVRDAGEQGVPGFTLTVRERDNSAMDQATNTAVTDDSGHYDIKETYPLGKWIVLEAFNTRYQTTGITYRADNEPAPTTKLGGLVDLDFLPIIGLGTTVDWGVQPYAAGTNGGIAGTVSYDTTRNELDPADAASESYQPGIPGVPVDLYQPKPCPTTDPTAMKNICRQGHEIVPMEDPDNPGTPNPDPNRGALVKGLKLNTYTTESWAAPRGCTARQWDGSVLTDQQALPGFGASANRLCVEAPMMGVATGPSDGTPDDAGQTVNGNYGFSTSTVNLYPPGDARNPHDLAIGDPLPDGEEQDLPAADYIVSVDIPNNPVGGGKMYQPTQEKDVNVFDGDAYLPQENFPPTQAQVSNPPDPPTGSPTPPSQPPSQQAGIISACAGPLSTVHVTNPTFIAGGGSPFEGYDRPSCADKLVTVRAGQTNAPNFNLFTAVPLPTHFWGLTLNDLGITLDKRSVNYGEAQGMPYVPVGLYDWSGRLVDTVHTDFNGLYEALEPSTSTYNCPVPAGPCPNMYRFVGNDPGAIGAPNADYNARFRTIAATFQGWPGLYTVTDEAPTQVAATVLTPDTTVANPTVCDLPTDMPQLYAVDHPYLRSNGARQLTIKGTGFGTKGTLTFGSTTVAATAWSNTQIVATVPTSLPQAPTTIRITNGDSGKDGYNMLTLQLLGTGSGPGNSTANPRLFEVGPGKPYATIQAAVNAAKTAAGTFKLVVVWPGAPTSLTPRGEYLENVIVNARMRIQGVGPGGFQGTTWVPGSIIDGSGFSPDNSIGQSWLTTLSTQQYTGSQAVPDAAVVTFLSNADSSALDGLRITGGIQSDFAGNVNVITGGIVTPYGATGALVTQGGGVYLHAGVTGVQLSNNLVVGNGGSYAGGIRVGTPYVTTNANTAVVIDHNQIRDNGGTNLAGGIGLFAGSNGYQVTNNAICGNHSSEYGGGISAFGFMGNTGSTAGGTIRGNRIWFNQSYDEGGGVMIAGELPATPEGLSPGSGPVTIDRNVIQANLANDDGGGIRLLQASGSNVTKPGATASSAAVALALGTITITNNTVANNVSAHEGGGVAIDDAVFVNLVNDTIAKNITTATAITSDGQPAPAGLSTAAVSAPLQARLNSQFAAGPLNRPANQLAGGAALGFSRPSILNDVFSDNRAGRYSSGDVLGIGATLADGSTDTVNNWDMGVVDPVGKLLSPVNSVIQSSQGTDGGTNTTVTGTPGLADPYDVSVSVLALRAYPAFRQAAIVTELLPFDLLGDYHLVGAGSAAYGRGAASTTTYWNSTHTTNPSSSFQYQVAAPTPDIDGNARPGTPGGRIDAGSDQVTP